MGLISPDVEGSADNIQETQSVTRNTLGIFSNEINENNFNELKNRFSSIFFQMLAQVAGISARWTIHQISAFNIHDAFVGLTTQCNILETYCKFLQANKDDLPDCYKTLERFAHSFKTYSGTLEGSMLSCFKSQLQLSDVSNILNTAITSLFETHDAISNLPRNGATIYLKEPLDTSTIHTSLITQALLMQNKRIQFSQNIDLPDDCKSYPEVFSLALENILSNAIKFTPEEGSIHLSVKRGENSIITNISDTGCGIPDSFDPFARGQTTDPNGTGLGLSQTKEAIEKIGGTIEHHKNVPNGTIFSFTIPATVDTK